MKRRGLSVSEELTGRFHSSVPGVRYFPRELTPLPIFALNDFKNSSRRKLVAAPEVFSLAVLYSHLETYSHVTPTTSLSNPKGES